MLQALYRMPCQEISWGNDRAEDLHQPASTLPAFRACQVTHKTNMEKPSNHKIQEIILPPDLEERTYAQFDELVSIGKIFYDEQTEPGEILDDGFLVSVQLQSFGATKLQGEANSDIFRLIQIEFRTVPFLQKKPVLPPDDPGRRSNHSTQTSRSNTPSTGPKNDGSDSSSPSASSSASPSPDTGVPKGPFINPKPEEVILDSVGQHHRLMLNKFCIYRPMLVIPTKEFALQSDDLDADDIAALWALLNAYHSFEPLAMYNRGVNGGSSQGHKHLQIFPAPPLAPFHGKAANFWPARATSSTEVADNIPNVPFKHFVLRIPPHASTETIIEMHDKLLALTRKAHAEAGNDPGSDYNVAMSREWIALIPRVTAGPPDGPFGTSTVGMLGIPAIRGPEDRRKWEELGNTRFLAQLGIPI